MTDQTISVQMPVPQQIQLQQGINPQPTSGITQAQADARYVRLPVGGNEGDVATNNGHDNSEWRPPTATSISYSSTNW